MIVSVIRSHLKSGVLDEYGSIAQQMSDLAVTMPGYISHKGFVGEDGERLTIVEFESEEALQNWKVHPEHLNAKRLGYTKFYSAFRFQVCKVISAREWVSQASGTQPESGALVLFGDIAES